MRGSGTEQRERAAGRGGRIAAALFLLLAALASALTASPEGSAVAAAPPGGAPPAGSGTVQSGAAVRVLTGDTFITWIAGRQTAVRIAGIVAEPYTTPCGAAAAARLWSLVAGGNLTLEEDPTLAFDARGLRVYHARTPDGRSLGQALVQAGLARADSTTATAQRRLDADEAQARAAKRGCLWGGASEPAPAAASPDTASPPSRQAAILPPGFAARTVASGLTEPTGFAFAPDGRLFIATKAGAVRVVKNGALLAAPLITLSARVNTYGDRGLLGIAVDPGFATGSPYVYLLYTYENDAANPTGAKTARLARYTVTGDTAAPASEQVLLGSVVGDAARPSCDTFAAGADCLVSDEISHSIGSLRFASDGTLFVSVGDGASFNFADDKAMRVQNLDLLAGKLLRITTTGQGLASNPFWNGDPAANRSKVWAYGFRNPFRFSLRPGTDVPYVGDTGWDTWEEVDVAVRGGNYGWPCYEGEARQAAYAPKPGCQALYAQGTGAVRFGLVTYGHVTSGYTPVSTAVIGGTFVTGTNYPAQYRGQYLWGDVQQFLRTIAVDARDARVAGPTEFAPTVDIPTDLQMGPDGSLYLAAIFSGAIQKIVYDANAPAAQASADTTSGPAPLAVQFSSAGTTDPAGGALSYLWDFGDGTSTSSAANPAHTYTLRCGLRACKYVATLTVTSAATGAAATAGLTIGVGPQPTATIAAPAASLIYNVGDVVSFRGSATDPLDGALPPAALAWQVRAQHCPGTCHAHPLTAQSGVASGTFTVPDYGDNSYLEISLTATNSAGVTKTTTVAIRPRTVRVTLQTSPPGLPVVYDGGVTYIAPQTFESVVGARRTITAPPLPSGVPFLGWSDGGAAQHDITIGPTDATYTATYAQPEPRPAGRPAAPPAATPPAPLPPPRSG